ncbi:MAG: DUF72 domain-containing protein [Calditrichia bacterium]
MKQENRIHVGTSGWNYPHWRGPFYPPELPTREWLRYYTGKLHTVEINNSFYRLPEKKTFESWRESAPPNFIFSVKASRYITHMKKLKDTEKPLTTFLDRVAGLGDKAGPILFQLPGGWNYDKDRLEKFLKSLPEGFRYTMELRNSTWWNPEVYQLLNQYGVAFCIFEIGGVMSPIEITADFIYLRLHGPGEKYQGCYDEQTLKQWAETFFSWRAQNKDVFCYFDNDQRGYAARNALELQNLITNSLGPEA